MTQFDSTIYDDKSVPTRSREVKLRCEKHLCVWGNAIPAQRWHNIRTTNPIESTFATILHHIKQANGCLAEERMPYGVQVRRVRLKDLALHARIQFTFQDDFRDQIYRRRNID